MNTNERREEIAQMSRTILSYCLSRTSNYADAEDMAQDILYECCKNAEKLRDEKAFYAFVWRIAGNVCNMWYRKKYRFIRCELDDKMPDTSPPVDTILEDNEHLGLVRRELAMLCSDYRRAAVEYYINGRSCRETAALLNISESMVKYLLFQTRKRIKEGVNMERIYGEQSYNPVKLGIRFWGNKNVYWDVLNSKIAQNIIMACYYEKLTEEQISIQLGVPTAYLEEHINKLLDYGLLTKSKTVYSSDIVIITKQELTEIRSANEKAIRKTSDYIKSAIGSAESEIRSIGFFGSDMPLNALKWQILEKLVHIVYVERFQEHLKLDFPTDKCGNKCFRWCTEEDNGNDPYEFGMSHNHSDKGMTEFWDVGINGNFIHMMVSDISAKVLISLYDTAPQTDTEKLICAELIKNGLAVKDGEKILPNCPVYTKEQHEKLRSLLEPAVQELLKDAEEIFPVIERYMTEYAPDRLKDYSKGLAPLQIFEEISEIVRMLCEDGWLLPYKGGILPTTSIVLN